MTAAACLLSKVQLRTTAGFSPQPHTPDVASNQTSHTADGRCFQVLGKNPAENIAPLWDWPTPTPSPSSLSYAAMPRHPARTYRPPDAHGGAAGFPRARRKLPVLRCPHIMLMHYPTEEVLFPSYPVPPIRGNWCRWIISAIYTNQKIARAGRIVYAPRKGSLLGAAAGTIIIGMSVYECRKPGA